MGRPVATCSFSQLLDYRSARGGLVAQHPSADLLPERHEDLLRESLGDRWGTDAGVIRPMCSQCPTVVSFPADRGASLPGRAAGEGTGGTFLSGMMLPRPSRPRLGRWRSTTCGHVAEGVRSGVTVGFGVGQLPYPHAVQHHEDESSHGPVSVPAGPRVGVLIDLLQVGGGHVRVDLRGGEIRMPQHLLNGPQIGPALQEMGGERVAERVRGNVFRQTRLP